MKRVPNFYIFVLIIFTSVSAVNAQTFAPGVEKTAVAKFEKSVAEYVSRREALESKLPKLSKQASAEEIDRHKKALLKKVLTDRRRAVRGTIFSRDAQQMIRTMIGSHYSGRDRMELRKELSEAENKTVRVRVNGVYPEAAELLEMPPTLLLVLPQLPKQVRYRFVGTNLLIVDRESHLIVDYMANALP
ncbi:MAG TPA: hypothetical protein VNA22_06330 [Pyrinomonadaceae bacterium]|nr:hypothetical protein [Pyrinomonadaceae bacterium]